LEKELEEYHQHLAKFKKGKEDTGKDVSFVGILILKKIVYTMLDLERKMS